MEFVGLKHLGIWDFVGLSMPAYKDKRFYEQALETALHSDTERQPQVNKEVAPLLQKHREQG